MYKNILVALDFSDDSKTLLEKADSLASQLNATLHVVNVIVDLNKVYEGLMGIEVEVSLSYQDKERKAIFDNWKKNLKSNMGELIVLRGDVVKEIQEASERLGVDLLIVGKHQDFWGKLFSYSKQLIKNTKTDVLVVPLKEE